MANKRTGSGAPRASLSQRVLPFRAQLASAVSLVVLAGVLAAVSDAARAQVTGQAGENGENATGTVPGAGGAGGLAGDHSVTSGSGGNGSASGNGSPGGGAAGGAGGAGSSPGAGGGGVESGGGGGGMGSGTGAGGGGGGGGGRGVTINMGTAFTNSSLITGGNGGNGGNGATTGSFVGGGGGGGGGIGMVFTGPSLVNTGSISGGAGGAGGLGTGLSYVPSLDDGGGGAGGTGLVANGAAVTNTGTIRGGNAGSGAVGKGGAGGAGITGSGLTIINNGTISGGFAGNGGPQADAIVFTGGTNLLTGTGTVGSFTMITGGTFTPGNGTPGTFMTVAGNLTFNTGSQYRVFLSPPATASFANVTGTATLTGGTVDPVFLPGAYTINDRFLILHTTGGLNGTTFGGQATTNFSYVLTYEPAPPVDVFLTITGAQLGAGTQLTVNEQNVSNAINEFFNGGGTLPPGFGALFSLSGPTLANALTQLSGEVGTGAERTAFGLMTQFLNLMTEPYAIGFAPERQPGFLKAPPMLKAPPLLEQRWTAWGAAFGGTNHANGDAVIGSHDITASDFGFAAGVDYHYSPGTLLGFALAGAGTN